MENVLYEYQLNLGDFLSNLIPLLVGVGFLYHSILLIKYKIELSGWEGFVASFFKIAGFIVAPLGIGMFFLSTIGMAIEHNEYRTRLTNNDIFIVERKLTYVPK